MDFLKGFGGGAIAYLLPGFLIQFGVSLKNKDDNTTGNDDLAGNVIVAIAPVIPAIATGSESVKRRAMLAAYNAFGNYLGFEMRTLPPGQ